ATSEAQWSPTGHYLITRPTGNGFTVLMATLQNNSGMTLTSLVVSYTLTVAQSATEEIFGHQVYYSLTGTAGSWQLVPSLLDSEQDNTAGTYVKSATWKVSWTNGALLYLLWADDNGSGSPDTALELDNFSLSPAVNSGSPISVGADGAGPLTFETLPS